MREETAAGGAPRATASHGHHGRFGSPADAADADSGADRGSPDPSLTEDPLKNVDLDQINQNSPFKPVFFAYDSAEVDGTGQATLTENAGVLKKTAPG